MICFECDPAFGGNLWHCHEASVRHDDGSTECLSDEPCELPHELHDVLLTCADIEPRCHCVAPTAAPHVHHDGYRVAA